MAEWLKAAVLKTVERKFRGFKSYFLRHFQKSPANFFAGLDILVTIW